MEKLEDRVLLDSAGIVWESASNLTLSFVPDDTQLDQHRSSLSATFDQICEADCWKSTILRAFEAWAVHANINIGLAEDDGLPFGTPGPAQQDPRFGDVRVGAIPLSQDVLAFSVPYDQVMSGTWVGDIVFNSEGGFHAIDDIFSVALHEAGHVLGLSHSEDPNSPMHVHGISEFTTPTAEDIEQLQLLHGTRDLDPNEAPLGVTDDPEPPGDPDPSDPPNEPGPPDEPGPTNPPDEGPGPGPGGSGQLGDNGVAADDGGAGQDGGTPSGGNQNLDGSPPVDENEGGEPNGGEGGPSGGGDPDGPPQHRQGVRNDSTQQATRLEILEWTEGEDLGPLAAVYGDVAGPNDVDFYALPVSSSDAAPLTVQLTSSGISLLNPHLSVLDENGNVVAESQSTNPLGDAVSLQLEPVNQDQIFFLRVTGAEPDSFGGYVLTAAANGAGVFDRVPLPVLAGLGTFGHLSGNDLQAYFRGDERPLLNHDRHQDDDFDASRELGTTPGFETNTRFHVVGSISDGTDVDHYSFTTPNLGVDSPDVMTVTVTSLDEGRLIPKVTVFEQGKTPLDSRILANGAGNYTVQLSNIGLDAKHFLRIESATHEAPFDTGNYRVTVMFGYKPIELETFASETLHLGQGQQLHTLHVAQPQLFHFAVGADANQLPEDAAVVMTVTNADHQELHRVAARVGETRSSSSVLLAPGTYTIGAFAATHDGSASGEVSYWIRGLAISKAIGIVSTDPTEDPLFDCPDVEDAYCYPDGTTASTSFLWSDVVSSVDPPPELETTEWIDIVPADWWSWYWETESGNNPPECHDDSYQTSQEQLLQVSAETGLLANDTDPEAGPLSTALIENVSHGTLTLGPDGSFTYVPDQGFVGADRFTYRTFDYSYLSDIASVTIDVQPTPLNAFIETASPDSRVQPVDELTIRFTQQVTGFGLEDLTLTRDGGANLLGDGLVNLSQADGATWLLSGLAELTDRPGAYQVTLNSGLSGIQSAGGAPLAGDQTETWDNVIQPGDANADGTFDQFDIIAAMQSARYATGEIATWAQGDWTGDGLFDQFDLVAALQAGRYVQPS